MPSTPAGTSPKVAKARFFDRFLRESAFLRHYIREYRGLVCLGLLALILVDLLEILPPILLMKAVDIATGNEPRAMLLKIALAYAGVALLQAVGRYGWRMYLIRASMFAGRDIRNRFTKHLFGLSASFFDKRPIGDLMSLATNDVEAVRMMIGSGLLTLADSLFYFATVPIAMYILSPKLTLLAFIPLPIIPWLVMRNEREIHERFEKVQECFSDLSAMTQESLNGVRVLKAFAKEDVQTGRFRDLGKKYIGLNLRLARVQSAFGPTLDFAMSIGMVLLLFVGGRELIGDEGALTLGTFVAFQRYIQKMVWPMAALGMALSSYQRSVSSSGRIEEVLERATDVPEPSEPKLPAGAPVDAGKVVPAHSTEWDERLLAGWKTQGKIEIRGLRFSFPGSEREVLKGIDLTIEPGQRVAFVGTIGSGKSALLSLLPRMYPVSRGMIRIDGVDVNDWPIHELRRQVGYVSQDLFLFSDTVSENVAYGIAQSLMQWTIEQDHLLIEEATQLACVHEDVLGLSGSYKTRVGERGVNLSGGQKQRLTIARAIVKKPAVLILDDALSSVDVQTEERILRGLRDRPGRNTELIAAHRISTIQESDQIAVIEGGLITQLGNHAQLLARREGLYRKLYEQQRLQEDLEAYSEAIDEAR